MEVTINYKFVHKSKRYSQKCEVSKIEFMYTSEKGKKEILGLYNQKLEELNINYKYQLIDTSFGVTNLIITGNASKPPIILVHGSNGCAPIALETYKGLENDFQIFAIDVLAQPNKSADTRLSMKNDDYGKWMHEVIDALKLKNVTLAGFSFGGLIILKTLEYSEKNIKEVFLTANALKPTFKKSLFGCKNSIVALNLFLWFTCPGVLGFATLEGLILI